MIFRNNTRYQYIAVDTAPGTSHRNPRGRASRDLGFDVCQLWTKGSNGRYEIIAHLDDIGSRYNKQWFLLSDNTVSVIYQLHIKILLVFDT